MKLKSKKHKKAEIKTKTNKIKRRIFIGIGKKNKNTSKIKKRVTKINKSYSKLEEFNNIPNFSFSASSPLCAKNENILGTNQKENEIKDFYYCDFNGIINIETNIRTNNSSGVKIDTTNFADE